VAGATGDKERPASAESRCREFMLEIVNSTAAANLPSHIPGGIISSSPRQIANRRDLACDFSTGVHLIA
jgi:hypothetical protein